MKEELERLVAIGKLDRRLVEPLLALHRSGYCVHRAWGCGKIMAFDPVLARMTIDFLSRAGHSMDLSFAAETLRPVPGDHILARKLSDLNGLRQMAATQPVELARIVLKSCQGKATLDQIQNLLVPDVIRDDWKKWWEGARRLLKKDGHFQVPVKKSEAIVYLEQEVGAQDRLLADMRAAKGLKARVLAVQELLKCIDDLADKEAAGREVVAALNTEIISHLKTMPGLALEGVFAREDIRAATGLPVGEGELDSRSVWLQDPSSPQPGPTLGAVLAETAPPKHSRVLDSYRAAFPDTWQDTALTLLNEVPAKAVGEIAELLIRADKLKLLKDKLVRLISQHLATSELLLWLARERTDAYADILGPEVFRAMMTAIERDQFLEKKSNKLRDYILGDHQLIVELIESADLDVIKDLTRTLQLSPSFDDMDKRSVLARIVKAYPSVQSLISAEHVKQDVTLLVTWESLERRKLEYQDIVEKQIPANARDIALARSYGDLRENHEYKAAKEMQKVLMRRKAELERDLTRARGTDFSHPRTDVVSPGCEVVVVAAGSEHRETFIIFGAWDFNLEKGVISYLSPIAQSLLNKAVGDEVEFEFEGTRSRYRIEAVRVPAELPQLFIGRPTATPADDAPDPASSTAPTPPPTDAGPGS